MKNSILKFLFIPFVVLSLTVNVFAESNEQKLYDGVTYNKERIMNTDNKEADVFSLTVDLQKAYTICGLPDNIKALQVGSKGQQTLSEMVAAAQKDGYTVYAAMNADFFYRFDENKIQPEGMVIRDGKLLNPIGTYNSFYGVMKNGKAFIGHIYDYTKHLGEFDQAVGGDYGALITNGKPITEDKQGGWHAVGDTDPRAAVGIKEDGTVFMVVVDGRSEKSDGFTLKQLAEYMHKQGCVTAINLDGGGSAQMGICDPETGKFKIVNNPSDGKERPIANAILVVSDREPNVPAKAPVSNTPKIVVMISGFILVTGLYAAAFIINLKNKKA